MTTPPPGWYPDPAGGPGSRWWDGQTWADLPAGSDPHPTPAASVPPVVPGGPGAPAAPARPNNGVAGLALAAAVVAAVIALAVFNVSRTSTPRFDAVGSPSSSTSTSSRSSSTSSGAGSPSETGTTVTGAQELFVDPDGVWDLSIGPGWTRSSSSINGMPQWTVGPPTTGIQSNVNVVTENLPITLTVDEYALAARTNLERITSIEVVGQEDIELADGTPAILLHYANSMAGTGTFPQDAVIAVKGEHAVIVTSSAGDAAGLAALAPYARSLHLR